MNEGALCSRIPPFVVSRRATNERPSLRNSNEHTVSSSTSSRAVRTEGAVRGFSAFGGGAARDLAFGFAAFAAGLAGFLTGLRADFDRAFFRAAGLRGFFATAPGIHEGD